MKIKSIFESALSLIGESIDGENAEDYTERAQYLAASFCCDVAEVDREYRETHGLPEQKQYDEVMLTLDSDFPLANRFAKACAHYIAAMLIVDENEFLSDKLFDKYCDSLATAVLEIPGQRKKISELY